MIVTEEEAKTKHCQETFNRGGIYDDRDRTCLGSACMAWRWNGPIEYEYGAALPIDTIPADPGWAIYDTFFEADQKKNRWRRMTPNRRGYCGKVGKP